MHCIDTKALVFMFNEGSSYAFTIHPTPEPRTPRALYDLWTAPWAWPSSLKMDSNEKVWNILNSLTARLCLANWINYNKGGYWEIGCHNLPISARYCSKSLDYSTWHHITCKWNLHTCRSLVWKARLLAMLIEFNSQSFLIKWQFSFKEVLLDLFH